MFKKYYYADTGGGTLCTTKGLIEGFHCNMYCMCQGKEEPP
jgi:hypothetical protein